MTFKVCFNVLLFGRFLQAWEDHHAAECGFLGIIQASGLNNFSFMALRLALSIIMRYR
jgi:hypothetical protein